MSTLDPAAVSSAPDSARPALKPVAIPPPRIWIGFVAAALCFAIDLAGWIGGSDSREELLFLSLPICLAGWVYWLFCIHRLHLILCRATGSDYPVGPRRAVGFQIIPFYSWVWCFKWSSQMARFVNEHSPAPMKTNWPGVLLILGSLVGNLALLVSCTSLRLFVLFGVTLYLSRKIKRVVTFDDPLHVARRKQLDMALTAGLGAAIGFLLIRALYEFWHKSKWDKVEDGLGILLLSLILSRFIEPLIGRVRAATGVEVDHPPPDEKRSWQVRAVIFLTLVFSNFFHDLLHGQMEHFDENWPSLVVGLLVCGGITYFWISGIRQEPRKAARFGMLSGAAIALFVTVMLAIAFGLKKEQANSDQQTANSAEACSLPEAQVPIGTSVHRVKFKVPFAGTSAWGWALLGLVGGLMIDKKWGRRGLRTVAIGMLSAAVLFAVAGVILAYIGSPVCRQAYIDEIWKRGADIGAVGGWCLGLLLHPANAAIFGTA